MRNREKELNNQEQEENLREIFRGKKLTEQEFTAVNILSRQDFNDLTNEQKIDIFNYSEFHERGNAALERFKDIFGEVREDELDRVTDRIIYDDVLVEKYDKFHKILNVELRNSRNLSVRLGNLLKEGLSLPEASEELDIELTFAEKLIKKEQKSELKDAKKRFKKTEKEMFKVNKKAESIFFLKEKGLTNVEISKALELPLKFVEKTVRALVFFKKVEPTKSGKATVEKEDIFYMQLADLRLKGFGNRDIAKKMDKNIEKIEHGTRFLIFAGMIEPASKSEAGKTRWNRREHKEEVRVYLNSLDKNNKISLRTVHEKSGLNIGYDLFRSLYFELSREQKVPPLKKNPPKV